MSELIQKKSANFDLNSPDLLEFGDAVIPETGPTAEPVGEKYVVFSLGSNAYAILCTQIAEIFQPLTITSLPITPDWLVGIANFRNEIISVIDLQLLLKKQASSPSAKSRLLVLRPESTEAPIALLIDRLCEMMKISDKSIERVSDEASPFICGKVSYKSDAMHLLDAPALLKSLVC